MKRIRFCVITKKVLAVRKYHFILIAHSTKIDQSSLIKLLPKTRITIGKINTSYIKTVNHRPTHHPSLSFIHIWNPFIIQRLFNDLISHMRGDYILQN